MSFHATANELAAVLLVLLGGSLAMVWVVDPTVLGDDLYVRVGSVVVCVSAVFGVVGLLASRRKVKQQAVQQFVDMLCRADRSAAATLPSHVGPSPRKSDPWGASLERLADCVRTYQHRVGEAEHGRAVAEVHCRRVFNQWHQMSEIVSGLSEPIVAIDHFDELVLTNPSAERLFHIKSDSTERRAVQECLACQELVDLLIDTRRRKLPAQRAGEIALVNDRGETRCFRVTCTGIATSFESEGKADTPHGAVAVLNDITHEKVIQKRNAEFVSSVSHEMKTPLAGIKAYVELLADGDAEDEETREEFLSVINSQADRLQRLIENLLNLARIEAGVVEVDKQQKSLNELLEAAFEVVQPAAQQKRITLKRDLSPMYLGVLVDRDMMMQTAINLLSNAIKYTPDGGTVTLRSQLHDEDISFEVEDTGVGLSEVDRVKVFEKFYRVQKDRQMASGTGLGLPLAKHIVEDVHGGKLTVDSELGKGSTFRVTLPCARQMKYVERS